MIGLNLGNLGLLVGAEIRVLPKNSDAPLGGNYAPPGDTQKTQ